MTNAVTSTESRALELLVSGYEPVQVAGALGISESRVSQLINDSEFSQKLVELRFDKLKKHNATDDQYDELEKKLADQLTRFSSLEMKPLAIARILQIVNSLKRRGSSAVENINRAKPVVQLQLPIAIINKFQVNAMNQVVQVRIGDEQQDLVTIQSGQIQQLADAMKAQSKIITDEPAIRNLGRKSRGAQYADILEECGFTNDLDEITTLSTVIR